MECDYQYDNSCLIKAEFIVKYKEPLQHNQKTIWYVCECCKNIMIEALKEHGIQYTIERIMAEKEMVVFT